MQPDERGVPVSQAAAVLGISVAAARKRVQRRTLRAYKVDGQWMVVLPTSTDVTYDTGRTVTLGHGYDAGQDPVIADLRDRVRFLEGMVGELMRRLPELPVGTTGPTPDMPTASTSADSGEAAADRVAAIIGRGRRPWWRWWR
jgi:hypothetical protein